MVKKKMEGKMIKTSVLIYKNASLPDPPELRRSSRDKTREHIYQQHENIKKYYKNKEKDIKNVLRIFKNIKYVKYRKNIIERLMIEKYGESYGNIITKKITEEYLMIPSISEKEDEYIIYEQSQLYLKSGLLPKTINENECENISYRKKNNYLKYLKINPDPRVIKYSAMELTSYLKKGYNITIDRREYIISA